ncbi:MAG: hypothetical protein NVS2B9_08710 [Myxococcales bacterium]
MVAMAVALLGMASAVQSTVDREHGGELHAVLQEEAPEVFLAKATLQQYLSRLVRKDWDAARRLTHPKAVSQIAALKKRTGQEHHTMAPWAQKQDQLKTFRFRGARQVGPGTIAVLVGEDTYHAREQGMTTDEGAIYLLFRSHGGFMVGDKMPGARLSQISPEAVRTGYRGWVDSASLAQARRGPSLPRR